MASRHSCKGRAFRLHHLVPPATAPVDQMCAFLAPILLDGSILEGGGQILRNAMSYAAILGRTISIEKIRQGRNPPGMKAQHRTGLLLVSQISRGSTLEGAGPGSETIRFVPGSIQPGNYTADPKTAGSTTLLLQISLPCLLCVSPSSSSILTLKGGTNATHAPQIDYTQLVFLPFLKRHFNIDVQMEVVSRGYYPRGGGVVQLSIPALSSKIPSVDLVDRGNVVSITGRSYVAGTLPTRLVYEIRSSAVSLLNVEGHSRDVPIVDIEAVKESPDGGSGMGIILIARTSTGCIIAGSCIGEKGMSARQIGEAAAKELGRNLAEGGCVDEYMQDQMIIFLALADGRSTVRAGPLTLHTKTAIWVAERLTEARFTTEEDVDAEGSKTTLIHCDGIGWHYKQSLAPEET